MERDLRAQGRIMQIDLKVVKLSFQCPVFDLDRDVKYQGTYQTMTKQGAITVNVSGLFVSRVLGDTRVQC